MKYTGWLMEWREDWSQLVTKCNWYTFTPIQLEFEWDKLMGGVECTIVLLGLGFRLRFNYAETEAVKDLQRMMDEIENEEHN